MLPDTTLTVSGRRAFIAASALPKACAISRTRANCLPLHRSASAGSLALISTANYKSSGISGETANGCDSKNAACTCSTGVWSPSGMSKLRPLRER